MNVAKNLPPGFITLPRRCRQSRTWLSETWVNTDCAIAMSNSTPKSASNRSVIRRFASGNRARASSSSSTR